MINCCNFTEILTITYCPSRIFCLCYVNPQERKPQAQRDWLDLLQGRAHNVHKVDVCALSLLLRRSLLWQPGPGSPQNRQRQRPGVLSSGLPWLQPLSPDSDSSCWRPTARSDARREAAPRSSGSLCPHRSCRSRACRSCCIHIRVPAVLPSPMRRSSCSPRAGQMHFHSPWSSHSFLLPGRSLSYLPPGALRRFVLHSHQYTDLPLPFLSRLQQNSRNTSQDRPRR